MKTQVLVFARFPAPGRAKTRLIPEIGPVVAARLQRYMTEHALDVLRAETSLNVRLCTTGAPVRAFRAWLGDGIACEPQPRGDLGLRLHRAFVSAFAGGASRAVAIGTDVPGISAPILREAIEALNDHDLVLGPAVDGGYYLIGMTRLHDRLFRGIDWGTGRVAAQTRTAARTAGLGVHELPLLQDIDRPENLAPLRRDPRFADVFTGRGRLSVVIPTLNEEAVIERTLDRMPRDNDVEVIVTDGGSRDRTAEIAARTGATVIEVGGGRAHQQNAAAARASGRFLLFLHADTLPPSGFVNMIRETLDAPATVAGAFRLAIDAPGGLLRLIEQSTEIRSRLLRRPYGDQGLFLERRVFDEMGGFAEIPIMEDYEFVGRLRRRGQISIRREAAITSARRWRRLGVLRTTLLNQAMLLGFRAGISPERLARVYRGTDRPSRDAPRDGDAERGVL